MSVEMVLAIAVCILLGIVIGVICISTGDDT